MKITPEHYSHLREAMRPKLPLVAEHLVAVAKDSRVKSPPMRTRWDWLYASGLTPWICDNLYKYANDEHIDTALRAIAKELCPELPELSR